MLPRLLWCLHRNFSWVYECLGVEWLGCKVWNSNLARCQIGFQSGCTGFCLCNIYGLVAPFKFGHGSSIRSPPGPSQCSVTPELVQVALFSLWVCVAVIPTHGSCPSSPVVLEARGATVTVCLAGLNRTSHRSPPPPSCWPVRQPGMQGQPPAGWKEVRPLTGQIFPGRQSHVPRAWVREMLSAWSLQRSRGEK